MSTSLGSVCLGIFNSFGILNSFNLPRHVQLLVCLNCCLPSTIFIWKNIKCSEWLPKPWKKNNTTCSDVHVGRKTPTLKLGWDLNAKEDGNVVSFGRPGQSIGLKEMARSLVYSWLHLVWKKLTVELVREGKQMQGTVEQSDFLNNFWFETKWVAVFLGALCTLGLCEDWQKMKT